MHLLMSVHYYYYAVMCWRFNEVEQNCMLPRIGPCVGSCVGRVLGRVLDVCWACVGRVLAVCWACVGDCIPKYCYNNTKHQNA